MNPLSFESLLVRGIVLFYDRRHDEARTAFQQAAAQKPTKRQSSWAGLNEIAAGRAAATATVCEAADGSWGRQTCLAIAYHKVGRREEARTILESVQREYGDALAYQYAQIHAQWGEPQAALRWLETAAKVHDPGLGEIRVDPMFDPMRNSSHLSEFIRSLNLPR